MRTMRALLALLALLGALSINVNVRAEVITSARYVDATGGNDANDGTSPATAWQSLAKVNAQTFGPDAQILFKAGESWSGRLAPKGSGAEGAPIRIDRYGEGEKPAIHGEGRVDEVIYLYNQPYWEISNLELTNLGEEVDFRRAIYIVAEDAGAVRHLRLTNLEIHDVNSSLNDNAGNPSRYYGGIFLEVVGDRLPTYFDDVLIADNHVYDVDRTGISLQSTWQIRSLLSSFGEEIRPGERDNWTPTTNLVIRNNLIEHIGGNGVIVRVAKNALVEHNRVFYAGEDISGNGMFCFNTDSTLFQFNEVAYTIYNEGDTDARGIDSDFRTKHTIIQYNYLHHNGKGGVVATGGAGTGTNAHRNFNDGTIIRYNLLVENEQHGIWASGKMSRMRVHNNVFYTSSALDSLEIVAHGAWSEGTPDDVVYFNNIFYHAGSGPSYDVVLGSNIHFTHNLYYYPEPARDQPEDPDGVFADPLFVDPLTEAEADDLHGFKLDASSPARGAGVRSDLIPARDYFGNLIAPEASVDVGVHQRGGTAP